MITNNKKARRNSGQRELIWQLVAAVNDHPTALQIYDRLRHDSPTASLGNVYRNLAILVEEGRLARKTLRDGIEHFDATTSDHCHFVCEQCCTVSDLDLPLHAEITAEARRKTRHDIKGHTIQFYGLCTRCSKENQRLKSPSTKKGRNQ
ncbi:MAG: transcriptional repressor [Candidatus Edwardsbacteria bacterium]|jgi:Fur family peroxide stress response transcriptional regulator|nr:transcriptional repressor [Candidatus Edwardsbacteria bacterium]